MSGRRPWQLSIWQSLRGAPMFSLGLHVDFHTPTIDLHLPGWTVQLGRNGYWGMAQQPLDRDRTYLGGRILVSKAPRWSGHTDNCDHVPEEWGVGPLSDFIEECLGGTPTLDAAWEAAEAALPNNLALFLHGSIVRRGQVYYAEAKRDLTAERQGHGWQAVEDTTADTPAAALLALADHLRFTEHEALG